MNCIAFLLSYISVNCIARTQFHRYETTLYISQYKILLSILDLSPEPCSGHNRPVRMTVRKKIFRLNTEKINTICFTWFCNLFHFYVPHGIIILSTQPDSLKWFSEIFVFYAYVFFYYPFVRSKHSLIFFFFFRFP